MKVHLVIREDQSELGYVDTSILGVYQERDAALLKERDELQQVRRQGLLVDGDRGVPDGEWQVSVFLSEHDVQP